MTSKFLGGALSSAAVLGAAWLFAATPSKETEINNNEPAAKKAARIQQLEKDISRLRKELEDERRKSEAGEVVALSKATLQQRIILLENERLMLQKTVTELENRILQLEEELAIRDESLKQLQQKSESN